VPTLYFAEGVPFFAVALIAGILYKRLGLRNDVITFTPVCCCCRGRSSHLWSPLIEMFKTKNSSWSSRACGGLSLALVALCLPLPGYFGYTLALLAVSLSARRPTTSPPMACISLAFPPKSRRRTRMAGRFYNAARFFSQGLDHPGGIPRTPVGVPRAWMAIFVAMD